MKSKRFSRFLSAVSAAVVWLLVASSVPARAQFGGSQIVFDPNMFARQLQQLQQETATVTNLAQQLQYAIKNTTGGGAGVWQSNQNLLTNLGDLINQQEGLSYTFQGLTQQFQQLYPGYNAASTAGVQSPQTTVDTTLDTLNGALASAQAQAQNFQAEQATLQNLELKNQTAIGNLQAVQVSNEIALAQVQQVQMLRQLVMAEMNSQNVAAANQVNNQVQSNLAAQAILLRASAARHSRLLSTVHRDSAPTLAIRSMRGRRDEPRQKPRHPCLGNHRSLRRALRRAGTSIKAKVAADQSATSFPTPAPSRPVPDLFTRCPRHRHNRRRTGGSGDDHDFQRHCDSILHRRCELQRSDPTVRLKLFFASASHRHPCYLDSIHRRRTARCTALSRAADQSTFSAAVSST